MCGTNHYERFKTVNFKRIYGYMLKYIKQRLAISKEKTNTLLKMVDRKNIAKTNKKSLIVFSEQINGNKKKTHINICTTPTSDNSRNN